jgi:hypothetical protein
MNNFLFLLHQCSHDLLGVLEMSQYESVCESVPQPSAQ